jgi:hypothetical protein
MLLDQRSENLDPPNGRHQVDAHGPVPRRLGPGAIRPTAADARVVDEDMHLAIAGSRGFGGLHEFGFERNVRFHAVDIDVGEPQLLERCGQSRFFNVAKHDFRPRLGEGGRDPQPNA